MPFLQAVAGGSGGSPGLAAVPEAGGFSGQMGTVKFRANPNNPSEPTVLFTDESTATDPMTGQINPTSLNSTVPKFSALYHDLHGDPASAYRIQVSRDANFSVSDLVWDSSFAPASWGPLGPPNDSPADTGSPLTAFAAESRCAAITYGSGIFPPHTNFTTLPISNTNSVTLPDLTVLPFPILYYWRIKFWDSTGRQGKWSEPALTGSTSTFRIVDLVPPAVSLLSPNSGAAAGGSTQTITWTATDANGVTTVDLHYSTDGGSTFPDPIASGLANTGSFGPWVVPSIDSNTVRVRVLARDPAGNGGTAVSSSNIIVDSTAPSAPGTPMAAPDPNNGVFTVTWTAAVDSGSGVASYTVQRMPFGGSYGTIASGVTGTSISESLGTGAYRYRVVAFDNVGQMGPVSGDSVFVNVDGISPAAVSDLTVLSLPPSEPTSSTLTLRWTAPGDNGNLGTATAYGLRYRTGGAVTPGNFLSSTPVTGLPTPSAAGSTETVTVTGLTPATVYFFGLGSVDDVGNQSLLSNSPGGITRIGAPTSLSAISGDGQVSLSWDAVAGASGYLVYYGPSSGTYTGTEAPQGVSPIDAGTGTSFILTLPNGVTHFIAVSAYAPSISTPGDLSAEISSMPSAGGGLELTRSVDGGTTAAAYRIISFPVLPAGTDPVEALADDLGIPHPARWRAFAWRPGVQEYVDLVKLRLAAGAAGIDLSEHQFRPGRALWVISREGASVDVSGQLANTGQPFPIVLKPGWNLIGDPFPFSVNWFQCRVNGVAMASQSFIGVEPWDFNGTYTIATRLTAGRGYFVRNLTASDAILTIPPILSSKPMWVEPGAYGVLYASSGPPPPAPGEVLESGRATVTATVSHPDEGAPASSGSPGAGLVASSGGGGGGGGGGCFVTRLAEEAPAAAGLMVLAFFVIGVGLWRGLSGAAQQA
ncbi:MAG: hypothetical protein HYY93_04680 [Planctomycetes bacterium]|nr:hypothetical protein [Planctomycetota bacterium]